LEAVIIVVVLPGSSWSATPVHRPRELDVVGAVLSVVGMGGVVLGILVWQEGGEFVGVLLALGGEPWRCWPSGYAGGSAPVSRH
jgi:hypothetical protein